MFAACRLHVLTPNSPGSWVGVCAFFGPTVIIDNSFLLFLCQHTIFTPDRNFAPSHYQSLTCRILPLSDIWKTSLFVWFFFFFVTLPSMSGSSWLEPLRKCSRGRGSDAAPRPLGILRSASSPCLARPPRQTWTSSSLHYGSIPIEKLH